MKKILMLCMAIATTCFVAMAVPAKPGVTTLTQSDGTQITVRTVGDEWHSAILTQDGLVVERAANGDFYYRTATGLSDVRAHNTLDRGAAEAQWVREHASSLTPQSLETTAGKARRASARLGGRPQKVGSTQVPTTGSPRVPIIVIEFSDKKLSNDISAFRSQYTSGSTSVYQYFADQSNNKYQPQFDVYGPYTLDNTRATYGAHGTDNQGNSVNDIGVARMVGEAVDKAGNDINWSQYDNDGDGEADVCIVVYAGVGEAQASTTVPSSIWPCQWNLSSGAYYGDGSGTRTRNSVTINRFAVFNEVHGSRDSGTTLDGVGTFCHEFSHCLGLPDFYETTYGNGYYGMGYWSLMNSGCYNNDGYTPIGYSAYEKEFMGWIDYITPVENTQYTLTAFNQKSEDTDMALKLVSPLNSNEYFILENRKKQGWDAYIKDEGVMISHVTYVANRWSGNTVNNEAIQLMTIMPADNVRSTSTETADLFGETNHEFTDESTPAAKLNMTASGSLASSTGGAGLLGKPVTEIYLNSDGSASLWYMKGSSSLPHLSAPVLADANHIKATSFRATWSDNNDTDHTYTLEVNRLGGYTLLLSETMEGLTSSSTNIANNLNEYLTNNGWTGTYLYPGTGYMQIGGRTSTWSSTYNAGTLVTPGLDLRHSGGKVTVKFNAAATGSTSLVVKCGNSSQTISGLTTSFAEKTVVLDCSAATGQKVTFAGNGTSGIVGVYGIEIYSGVEEDATGAPLRAVSETGDANQRTITGITDKTYTVTGLTEGETYSFRVKAVPVDPEVAVESTWSNVKEVTLVETPPTLAFNKSEVNMGNVEVDATGTATFTVTGTDLDADVTLTLADESGYFSLDKTSLTIDEAEQGATVTATFAPQVSGTFSATVTAATAGAQAVSLTLTGTAPLVKAVPVMLAADEATVGTTSFTAAWTDDTPAENVVSYTLSVNGGEAEQVYLLAEEDFSNVTWTKSGITSSSNGYLQIGNARGSKGRVTSALLTPTSNVITVNVAALSPAANASMKILLLNSANSEVASETYSLSTDEATFTKIFDVTPNTQYKVRFENVTGYAVLHNATVYNGDATAADAPAYATETGDANHRTITGITDKSYTVENLVAGATYSYKVKAIYADDTESRWSNTQNVTLNETTPVIEATPTALSLEAAEGETASTSFAVAAHDLQGDVTLTLNDESGAFGLSTGSLNAAEADGATVTVTFAPTTAGDYSATIVLASEGAESVTVTLAGTATIAKQVPVMEEADQQTVTERSFIATWTAVPNVESYTLQVTRAGSNGAAARVEESGDASNRTITGITETSYAVANLERATTYRYRVQAVYTDGTESEWSNVQMVTTKVKTGINAIAAGGRVTLNGNVLTGDEFTRVYNVAGQEIPAIDGTWTLDRGIYLIATPEGAAKIQVK